LGPEPDADIQLLQDREHFFDQHFGFASDRFGIGSRSRKLS
jgi:hypothetical protein